MSRSTIVMENVGKLYRIGRGSHSGTFRDAFSEVVGAAFRRFRHMGEDRAKQEDFWALRDISFDIKEGEAVGLLGRNGAGKSTLLKILSRITEPTTGRVRLRGRVGTLLEVGTGFHPELSGRENIYLNGAILGMRRSEIKKKFDEIVAFSEVERFLDTPVKRYSTGMYIRLAFAVAAHLEPEILLVDEILSVGDLEFQKKCLGKMNDVVGQGRTVIFVSHHMESITALTTRCLVFRSGQLLLDAPTDEAVRYHAEMSLKGTEQGEVYHSTRTDRDENFVSEARVITSEKFGQHAWGESLAFEFVLHIGRPMARLGFYFNIVNSRGARVTQLWDFAEDHPFRRRPGDYRVRCEIPKSRLYKGRYSVTTCLTESRGIVPMEILPDLCPFEVVMGGYVREVLEWAEDMSVYIEDFTWQPVETL